MSRDGREARERQCAVAAPAPSAAVSGGTLLVASTGKIGRKRIIVKGPEPMDPERSESPDGPSQSPTAGPVMTLSSDLADDDLTESLFALAGLSSARLSLEDLLTRVASFAVQAIPGADGAGLTLLEDDRPDTSSRVSSSSERSTTSNTASTKDPASALPRPGRRCGPGH